MISRPGRHGLTVYLGLLRTKVLGYRRAPHSSFKRAHCCGEIGAFEYPDGHTYPPNHEIPRRTTPNDSTTLH